MLDLKVNYDPNISIAAYMSGETTDPALASQYLRGGLVPRNLVQMSEISTNFRDAVMSFLLSNADTEERSRTLEILSAAIAGTPDGMDNTVKAYSEYLAPLAYAWGETVVATRAILRNKPGSAGNYLGTVAGALSKQMDHGAFHDILVNSTQNSVDVVVMEKAQGKY